MDFDAEAVLEIAARGEGREVEFKRGLPGPAKTARSLVAFANTRGGVLLIGITDRGALWGVAQPRAVAAALREIARERADPPIAVHVQAVRVGEQQVVACSVPLSPDRPHHLLLDGGERELVVRVGASNRAATGATLAALQQPHRRGPANDLERRVLAWLAASGAARPPPWRASPRRATSARSAPAAPSSSSSAPDASWPTDSARGGCTSSPSR